MSRKPEFPKLIRVGSVTVRLYRVTNGPRPFYEIRFREWCPDAKEWTWKRICRTDKAVAITLGAKIAEQLAIGQSTRQALDEDDARELIEARGLLEPTGLTILAASQIVHQQWLDKLVSPIQPVTVADAVERYREFKRREGIGELYAKDLRLRLGAFAKDFQLSLSDLTAQAVGQWFEGRSFAARSSNNTRNTLLCFFNWAKEQRYLPDGANLLETVPKIRIRRRRIPIWTPDQMEKLLANAQTKLIPFLTLAGFAGLRSEEIRRLEWSAIRWESKEIFIDGHVAKSVRDARPRSVPLLPVLEAWLAPWRTATGRVETYERSSKAAVKLAQRLGLEWQRNGLRHSFISYRVAKVSNVTQVSTEAGNSPADVHQSYLQLTVKTDADKWFNLYPESTEEKVITPKFK